MRIFNKADDSASTLKHLQEEGLQFSEMASNIPGYDRGYYRNGFKQIWIVVFKNGFNIFTSASTMVIVSVVLQMHQNAHSS